MVILPWSYLTILGSKGACPMSRGFRDMGLSPAACRVPRFRGCPTQAFFRLAWELAGPLPHPHPRDQPNRKRRSCSHALCLFYKFPLAHFDPYPATFPEFIFPVDPMPYRDSCNFFLLTSIRPAPGAPNYRVTSYVSGSYVKFVIPPNLEAAPEIIPPLHPKILNGSAPNSLTL